MHRRPRTVQRAVRRLQRQRRARAPKEREKAVLERRRASLEANLREGGVVREASRRRRLLLPAPRSRRGAGSHGWRAFHVSAGKVSKSWSAQAKKPAAASAARGGRRGRLLSSSSCADRFTSTLPRRLRLTTSAPRVPPTTTVATEAVSVLLAARRSRCVSGVYTGGERSFQLAESHEPGCVLRGMWFYGDSKNRPGCVLATQRPSGVATAGAVGVREQSVAFESRAFRRARRGRRGA